MTSTMEGQASAPPSSGQSDQPGQGQTYPPQTAPSTQQTGQGQAGPRVIRISHQAVPVVMMQMNADGVLSHTHPRSNVLLCVTPNRPAASWGFSHSLHFPLFLSVNRTLLTFHLKS
ncbi:unnamed protein product [Tetraodon nigroviridis]|uniref:(spotted green pufferfish) hypothetical protein n=1 Tax=Tetraodon nigroviridis TaxID=99883 RepID=Q4SYM9_TETNG|nr:unnamed protein product [Tetraodon nigroviridis]